MMIEVNLLPAELRRVEHTPLPRLLVVIIGTASIMAMGAFGVVVNWRRVPDLKAKESDLVADIQHRGKQAEAYDRLLEDIAETRDRKKAIAEMWRTRIIWSEKLAQLADMTPSFVGLKQLRLTETRASARTKKQAGGEFTIDSLSATSDHKRVAYYRRVVEGQVRAQNSDNPWVGRDFFEPFVEILPNPTQKVDVKDYEEREALKFVLKMPVKPPSERLGEAVRAATEERNRKRAGPRTRSAPSRKPTPEPAEGTEQPEPEIPTTPAAAPEGPAAGETPATTASTETAESSDAGVLGALRGILKQKAAEAARTEEHRKDKAEPPPTPQATKTEETGLVEEKEAAEK